MKREDRLAEYRDEDIAEVKEMMDKSFEWFLEVHGIEDKKNPEKKKMPPGLMLFDLMESKEGRELAAWQSLMMRMEYPSRRFTGMFDMEKVLNNPNFDPMDVFPMEILNAILLGREFDLYPHWDGDFYFAFPKGVSSHAEVGVIVTGEMWDYMGKKEEVDGDSGEGSEAGGDGPGHTAGSGEPEETEGDGEPGDQSDGEASPDSG